MGNVSMQLEDMDMRRAIRAGLRRGDESARIKALLSVYAEKTALEGLLGKISKDPASPGYIESRAFLLHNHTVSNLLDVLLLDLFREEFGGMDTSLKDALLVSLLNAPQERCGLLDEFKLLPLADGRRILHDGYSIKSIEIVKETGQGTAGQEATQAEAQPAKCFTALNIVLDPYHEKFDLDVKAAAVNLGVIGSERLVVLNPDKIFSPVLEWALATFAKLAGFAQLAYVPVPVGDETPYFSQLDGRLFIASKEGRRIVLSSIAGIESEEGIFITPSLLVNNGIVIFNGREIGKTSEGMHSIPLEALLEGVSNGS